MKRLLALSLLFAATGFAAPPELALKSTDGKAITLDAYRGKVVVVNFWATWCTPCAIEMKNFVKLHERYAAQPVEIVAVSLDDERTTKYIEPFIRSRKMTFPVLVGASDQDVKHFGGKGTLPFTAVLGKDGEILARFDRQVKEDELARIVTDALSH